MAIVENPIVNSIKYFIIPNIFFEIPPIHRPEPANAGRFFGPHWQLLFPRLAGAAACCGPSAEAVVLE